MNWPFRYSELFYNRFHYSLTGMCCVTMVMGDPKTERAHSGGCAGRVENRTETRCHLQTPRPIHTKLEILRLLSHWGGWAVSGKALLVLSALYCSFNCTF